MQQGGTQVGHPAARRSGRRRGITAAALGCALALAGCGIGPGPSVGSVDLTVTHNYGTEPVLSKQISNVHESDDVMRVLDRGADITTRYGGDFAQSINGVAGGAPGGRVHDWFYFVNGVEAGVGAADFPVHDGDRIWWDYRDWTAAMRIPAVVGSWPEPFLHGYEGAFHPVSLECTGAGAACGTVRERLKGIGADLRGTHDNLEEMKVIAGPWSDIRDDEDVPELEGDPSQSGVFGQFQRHRKGFTLSTLDTGGSAVHRLGPGTGLVFATHRDGDPPVWVITGTDRAGVEAASKLLDSADLHDRYAVAVTAAGHVIPLPEQ